MHACDSERTLDMTDRRSCFALHTEGKNLWFFLTIHFVDKTFRQDWPVLKESFSGVCKIEPYTVGVVVVVGYPSRASASVNEKYFSAEPKNFGPGVTRYAASNGVVRFWFRCSFSTLRSHFAKSLCEMSTNTQKNTSKLSPARGRKINSLRMFVF